MILVWVVLIGLASYRLWRLVGEDTITEPLRDRLPAVIREPAECCWCMGSWVVFLVTYLADITIGIEAPVLVGLAAAVVVGWLGENV